MRSLAADLSPLLNPVATISSLDRQKPPVSGNLQPDPGVVIGECQDDDGRQYRDAGALHRAPDHVASLLSLERPIR
jgi:hypothetical protein